MLKTLTFIILIISCELKAQLTTNNSFSADQLVRSILVGKGVTVSNITYTGKDGAIGEFEGSQSNIGVSDGIILSTGSVLDHVKSGKKNGPVGPNNSGGATTNWYFDNPLYGDLDLDNLVNGSTFDAAVLEFDFIPQGDTVEFQYIFASEEYPQFVNSGYNDVFAFFISGPGISGGVKNLAVVPGTSNPVSIDAINTSTNSSLFVSNGNGLAGSQFTDPKVVQFNGFTVPLTAISKVTPCENYHLKIAIADFGDGSFDSGVFLKGGSLSSSAQFSSNQTSSIDVGTENLIPEGCSNGILSLNRTEKLWITYNLNYSIYGTAQNGIDYNTLSGTASFPPNVSNVDLKIIPISDGLVESDEKVILRFPNPYVCETDSVDYTYIISDLSVLRSSPDSIESVCPGDQVSISANFTGGYSPYIYSWSNGSSNVSTSVSPNSTNNYQFTVSDVCGSSTSNNLRVKVPNLSALELIMPNDTTVGCLGVDVFLNPLVSGGSGTYDFIWSTNDKTQSISTQILESNTYDLSVTDACGSSKNGNVKIDLDYPELFVNLVKDTVACPNDSIMFFAFASGGYSPYVYVWENGDISQRSVFSSSTSRTINISVTDSCGIIPTVDSVLLTIQKPTANFVVNSPSLETGAVIYFIDNSEGQVETYEWDFGNGESSNIYNPNTVFEYDSTFTVQLLVTDSMGCLDSVKQDLDLTTSIYLWVPNAFSPNIYKDDLNSQFFARGKGIEKFKISIFNRWGTEVFSSFDINEGWDGKFISGKLAPTGVYVYKISVKGVSGKELEKFGSVMLYR